MCNLYEIPQSMADMAAHFGVADPPKLEIPHETKRGEPGIIVRGSVGQRMMLPATWGFPRPQKDRGGALLHHEPVNLIADLTNPMWRTMAPDARYRCLIPVTTFAQPDGKRGSMTRTWFRTKDWPIFAWAGFCRKSEEWGPVYGAVTTDSNSAVAPLNPRMPVMLAPDEYEQWLEGSIDDVIEFQFRPPSRPLAWKSSARKTCGCSGPARATAHCFEPGDTAGLPDSRSRHVHSLHRAQKQG